MHLAPWEKPVIKSEKLNMSKAKKRNSSRTWGSRELPEGARQPEAEGELTLEQPF